MKYQLVLLAIWWASYVHGQNLIQNPDCELPLINRKIPYWVEVAGGQWGARSMSPSPQNGKQYFFAGVGQELELAQTITLTNASLTNQGSMNFHFLGYVRAYSQKPTDQSQIIIEMLDGNDAILQTYDLGIYDEFREWVVIDKLLKAQAPTRKIKIRLLSHRKNGSNNDGYFDNLALIAEPLLSKAPVNSGPIQAVVSGQVFDKKTLKPIRTVLSVVGDQSPRQTVNTRFDGTYSVNVPVNDVSIISIDDTNEYFGVNWFFATFGESR